MNRLEGKVAVVTGGNSGIGLASAQRQAEEGARVAISGRNQKTLDEAVKIIGHNVLAIQADTTTIADTEKFFKEVAHKLGKIDILFVNAGVAQFLPISDVTEKHFDEQFNTNVRGA
jgi:NAD(P)-dependent dehydrogenase (short-subunit alcohol dehydrogenase family)